MLLTARRQLPRKLLLHAQVTGPETGFCLPACLSVGLTICESVCLSACLSVCLSACVSAAVSVSVHTEDVAYTLSLPQHADTIGILDPGYTLKHGLPKMCSYNMCFYAFGSCMPLLVLVLGACCDHKANTVVTCAGLQQADAVLLIFTLAAVAPEEMVVMLRTAFQVLTLLCVLVIGCLLA